jgi:hypothetical protein
MSNGPINPLGRSRSGRPDNKMDAEQQAEIRSACDRAARLITANERALQKARQLLTALETARQGSRPGDVQKKLMSRDRGG